ncbi:hypothetical protein [Spirochaeta dissipatitropha]
MDFLTKMKESISVGMDGSRKFLERARHKMQDVGESSVLKLEIHQLENQLKQEYTSFGTQVYGMLSDGEKNSISLKTPELKENYGEIERVIDLIAEKKKLLKVQEEIEQSGQTDVDVQDGESVQEKED